MRGCIAKRNERRYETERTKSLIHFFYGIPLKCHDVSETNSVGVFHCLNIEDYENYI